MRIDAARCSEQCIVSESIILGCLPKASPPINITTNKQSPTDIGITTIKPNHWNQNEQSILLDRRRRGRPCWLRWHPPLEGLLIPWRGGLWGKDRRPQQLWRGRLDGPPQRWRGGLEGAPQQAFIREWAGGACRGRGRCGQGRGRCGQGRGRCGQGPGRCSRGTGRCSRGTGRCIRGRVLRERRLEPLGQVCHAEGRNAGIGRLPQPPAMRDITPVPGLILGKEITVQVPNRKTNKQTTMLSHCPTRKQTAPTTLRQKNTQATIGGSIQQRANKNNRSTASPDKQH
jgi:hypothetical protein